MTFDETVSIPQDQTITLESLMDGPLEMNHLEKGWTRNLVVNKGDTISLTADQGGPSTVSYSTQRFRLLTMESPGAA